MQERFKFRAYDRIHKVMHYNVEMDDKKRFFSSVLQNDCFVLMQSTGLKDRKGKLIYEGDLLKTRFGLILKVYWREQSAMFWLETLDGVIPFTFYAKQQLDGDLMEVVGNIYENKELLEEKK